MLSVRGIPQLLCLNVHATHGTQIQGVTEQKMSVALLTFGENVDQSLIKGRSAENDVYMVVVLYVAIEIILIITCYN